MFPNFVTSFSKWHPYCYLLLRVPSALWCSTRSQLTFPSSCCVWFLGFMLYVILRTCFAIEFLFFVLFAPSVLIFFPHLCLAKLKFHLKLFAAMIVYGDREIQLLWSLQFLTHFLHVFGNRHTHTIQKRRATGRFAIWLHDRTFL